jgi:chromodomain-helicase-DNA-binding protein 1
LDVRKRARYRISSVFLTLYCLRFVTLFWPKKVRAGKLEEIHAKMVIKEGGDVTVPKKPRLSSNGKPPAGNGATPSSSARTNGKSYR